MTPVACGNKISSLRPCDTVAAALLTDPLATHSAALLTTGSCVPISRHGVAPHPASQFLTSKTIFYVNIDIILVLQYLELYHKI